MATTLIENIVNELTELVTQKVLEEFNRRADLVPDHEARLNALERANFVRRADLYGSFVTRDDLLVDEALINDRLVAMENALAAQPVVDANFVDERIDDWMQRRLNNEVAEIFERVDLDYKIQRAIEDTDFDDAIKEAVEDRLECTNFINEEDLQNFLGQHEYVNTADLTEFLNDRVRITVE